MIYKNTLIYDLETATKNEGEIDGEQDEFRVFGCYSYLKKRSYVITNKEDMRKVFNEHKYLVGFNTLCYDNPVLKRAGFHKEIQKDDYGNWNFQYKYNIDLQQIIIKRCKSMKIASGYLNKLLVDFKLATVVKVLGLVDENTGKGDLDYSILKKKTWTKQEWQQIKEYTLRDIEITKKLYEYLEEYFGYFKDFCSQKMIKNKFYLKSSIASYTYNYACKENGWNFDFEDDESIEHNKFGGGYTVYPAGEKFSIGKHIQYFGRTVKLHHILYFDFTSLYPFIIAMFNLFSKSDTGFNGNDFFKVDGTYNNTVQGKFEKFIMKLYRLRAKFKSENDPREYVIKIIINTFYGLLGNPKFKYLYNPVGGSDCTKLGRQFHKLARKMFFEAGYVLIYGDTDSVFIGDPFGDVDRMLKVRDRIVKTIMDNCPFPQDNFDFKIDDELTDIWFFHGKDKNNDKASDTEMDEYDIPNKKLGLMKKNYIYRGIKKDKKGKVIGHKLVVKNLGVNKSDCTKVTNEIFWNIMRPIILKEKTVKQSKTFFRNHINRLIEQDISLVSKRYNLKPLAKYKDERGHHATLSKRYGPGVVFIIKNTQFGAGKLKGSKYCSVEEFKEKRLKTRHVDLSKTWSELDYFIKKKKIVKLSEYGIT